MMQPITMNNLSSEKNCITGYKVYPPNPQFFGTMAPQLVATTKCAS